MKRLHLFCGDKLWPAFTNCDQYVAAADLNVDCSKLDSFNEGEVDEIYVIHGLEHLHRITAERALKDWYRVLVPGGRLILELPSLDKIVEMLHAGEKNLRLTLLGLFGDPRDPKQGMEHKWCWSQEELTGSLQAAGFTDIAFMEPAFHVPKRDMRVTAVKPNHLGDGDAKPDSN